MCEGSSYVPWRGAAGAAAAAAEGRLGSTSCQGRLFVSVPRRSWGGLSSVTRSHSFSAAPFFPQSLLFSLILPTSSSSHFPSQPLLVTLLPAPTCPLSTCSSSMASKTGPCFWQEVVWFGIYIQVIRFYSATSMENRCQGVNRVLVLNIGNWCVWLGAPAEGCRDSGSSLALIFSSTISLTTDSHI